MEHLINWILLRAKKFYHWFFSYYQNVHNDCNCCRNKQQRQPPINPFPEVDSFNFKLTGPTSELWAWDETCWRRLQASENSFVFKKTIIQSTLHEYSMLKASFNSVDSSLICMHQIKCQTGASRTWWCIAPMRLLAKYSRPMLVDRIDNPRLPTKGDCHRFTWVGWQRGFSWNYVSPTCNINENERRVSNKIENLVVFNFYVFYIPWTK